MSYSVSITCFNMNGSEQGLKIQSQVYWSINLVKFEQQDL